MNVGLKVDVTIGGLQCAVWMSTLALAMRTAKRHLRTILTEHELAVMVRESTQALTAPKCVSVCMYVNGCALRCVRRVQDLCRPGEPALRGGRYYRSAEMHQSAPTSRSPGGFPFAPTVPIPKSQVSVGSTAVHMQSGDGRRSRPPEAVQQDVSDSGR